MTNGKKLIERIKEFGEVGREMSKLIDESPIAAAYVLEQISESEMPGKCVFYASVAYRFAEEAKSEEVKNQIMNSILGYLYEHSKYFKPKGEE